MDVFESWTSGPLVKKNEWTHVAFCRNGNAYILFWINGQIANNTSSWGSYTYNRSFSGSQRMCFGRNMDGTSYNMHGNISNARVHIGEQVYSSNFTPLKEPLTSSNSNGNASKCVYLGLQKRIPTESTIGPNLYQGDNGAQTSYDHPF